MPYTKCTCSGNVVTSMTVQLTTGCMYPPFTYRLLHQDVTSDHSALTSALPQTKQAKVAHQSHSLSLTWKELSTQHGCAKTTSKIWTNLTQMQAPTRQRVTAALKAANSACSRCHCTSRQATFHFTATSDITTYSMYSIELETAAVKVQ